MLRSAVVLLASFLVLAAPTQATSNAQAVATFINNRVVEALHSGDGDVGAELLLPRSAKHFQLASAHHTGMRRLHSHQDVQDQPGSYGTEMSHAAKVLTATKAKLASLLQAAPDGRYQADDTQEEAHAPVHITNLQGAPQDASSSDASSTSLGSAPESDVAVAGLAGLFTGGESAAAEEADAESPVASRQPAQGSTTAAAAAATATAPQQQPRRQSACMGHVDRSSSSSCKWAVDAGGQHSTC